MASQGFYNILVSERLVDSLPKLLKNDEASITSNAGTSFPTSPMEGMQCYRTDLKRLYQYRDGEWRFISTSGLPLVIPNETSQTATLTADVQDFEGYVQGTQVLLRLPFVNASNTTLNINGLGAKPVYYRQNTTGGGYIQANSVVMLVYEEVTVSTGCWKILYSWDSNNYERLSITAFAPIAASSGVYGSQPALVTPDGKIATICTSNTSNTNKTVSTLGFLPNVMWHHNHSENKTSGQSVSSSSIYMVTQGVDGRFWMNIGTADLEAQKPIYLKGTIKSDGLFYIDTANWWTQDLPTTDDGKVYWLVGNMYSEYQYTKVTPNPMYQFKNGKLSIFGSGGEGGGVSSYTPISDCNFNTVTNAGYYRVTGTTFTNAPSGLGANSAGFLTVAGIWDTASDARLFQFLQSANGTLWMRVATGQTWGSWIQYADNSEVVHTTGNETIDGYKKFSKQLNAEYFGTPNHVMLGFPGVRGSDVPAKIEKIIAFCDQADTLDLSTAGTRRVATVSTAVGPDKAVTLSLCANAWDSESLSSKGIKVQVKPDNTLSAYLTDNPPTNSNNAAIATTWWCKQFGLGMGFDVATNQGSGPSEVKDCNEIHYSGFYTCSASTANTPSGSAGVLINVSRLYNNGAQGQIYFTTNATYFRQANLTDGTYAWTAWNRIEPNQFENFVQTGALDFNTLKDGGFYHVNQSGSTNAPENAPFDVMVVKNSPTSDSIHQVAFSCADNETRRARMYHRCCTNGTWSPWTKVADDAQVVHTTGNETIGGVKTFSSDIRANNITAGGHIMLGIPNTRGDEVTTAIEKNIAWYDQSDTQNPSTAGDRRVGTLTCQVGSDKTVTLSLLAVQWDVNGSSKGIKVQVRPDGTLNCYLTNHPPETSNDLALATTYWVNSKGYATESFVTGKGYAVDTGVVHLTGDETIAGTKTFSSAVSAPSFTATSDIRLKDNLKEETYDLSSLKTFSYDFKEDSKRHVGLIAQEVQKIIPEAVSEREDGYLTLDYNAVVAALVGEVNSLKAELAELKEKINESK